MAVRNLEREVPALTRLKVVVRLELRGRGDVQVFRVRLPAPEVTKGEPEDARLDLAMSRSMFNKFAEKGQLKDWRQAYELRRMDVWGDDAGQPQVRWQAVVRERARAAEHTVDGHVEVRWSHGRFGKPPEAKVYLDTPHHRVPGYVTLT